MQGIDTAVVPIIHMHCEHQVVENGKIVLSGGYVDLTVVSDNSPSQSNNQQAVKVHIACV